MASGQRLRIEVKPCFEPAHSDPATHRFLFIYYVTILNEGDRPVHLLARHWLITDGNGKIEEIRSEGVVGEQPVIEPGEEYFYNSFCILDTSVGSMQGEYTMMDENGDLFEAAIPMFTLSVPGALN